MHFLFTVTFPPSTNALSYNFHGPVHTSYVWLPRLLVIRQVENLGAFSHKQTAFLALNRLERLFLLERERRSRPFDVGVAPDVAHRTSDEQGSFCGAPSFVVAPATVAYRLSHVSRNIIIIGEIDGNNSSFVRCIIRQVNTSGSMSARCSPSSRR